MKKLSFFLFFIILLTTKGWSQTDKTQLKSGNGSVKQVDKLNKEAETLWQSGEYTKGMKVAVLAQKMAHSIAYEKGEAYALNNIGIIYDYQGLYAESLSNYFKALPLQKKIKDENGLSYTYNNIGLIYSNQGNYKEALKNYNKALELREKNGDKSGLSSTYNNIGILHMYAKDYDLALKSYFSSIKIDSALHDEMGVSASMSNIGLVYMDQNDFEKAQEYFSQSLAIREKLNDKRGIANSCNNFGTLFQKQKKYDEAKKYLLRGLEIGQSMGAKDLIRYSYQILYNIEEEQGNKAQAFKYYKNYVSYGDSITNETNTKKQTEAEMQFKFDQQQAEEKLKEEKQNLIDQQQRQQQQYLLWTLLFIIFLILLFLGFINKQRKIEKDQKLLIHDQKILVEEKNREILDSITYAKRIQSAILPPDKLVKEFLTDSFILYKPKDIVAGDFYWIEPLKDKIIFAVADCTGHGVPGALISVVCHNALNRSVREFNLMDPAEILNKTREIILHEFQKSDDIVNDGMDISICSLDLEHKTLLWSGANSPLWIIKSNTKELIELKPAKQPIGQFTNYIPFETTSLTLDKNDLIYLFTDGFADQFGGEFGKKMKAKRMRELLLSLSEETMVTQKSKIELAFDNWKSNFEQVDDVCMIGLRI